jgi:hypothetical protein
MMNGAWHGCANFPMPNIASDMRVSSEQCSDVSSESVKQYILTEHDIRDR